MEDFTVVVRKMDVIYRDRCILQLFLYVFIQLNRPLQFRLFQYICHLTGYRTDFSNIFKMGDTSHDRRNNAERHNNDKDKNRCGQSAGPVQQASDGKDAYKRCRKGNIKNVGRSDTAAHPADKTVCTFPGCTYKLTV